MQVVLLLLTTPDTSMAQLFSGGLSSVLGGSSDPCWVGGSSMSYFGTSFGHHAANCNATASGAGRKLRGGSFTAAVL